MPIRTLTLFFFHVYIGVVPSFTPTAVKVTDVPEQIGPEGFADMVTLAVTAGFTVTAKADEAALFPQLLNGVTEMFPDVAPAKKLTVMELVLAPVAMEAPAGNDQL